MDPPVAIGEHHILLFLLQMLLLLGCARGLGLLFRRWGQPSIGAEILVGICFGPSILGRLWPGLQAALFPADPVQHAMLAAVAWLGILFFLLDTGLETDFATAWRQRHGAMVIAFSDLLLPMAIAFIPCLFLPASFLVSADSRLLFAAFVGTIMTISALPVTARVLQDLNLYRSDLGLLIMCALTVNDVAGWLVFAVILGIAGESIVSLSAIPLILGATIAFTAVALTFGRGLTNRVLLRFRDWDLPEPGSSLTFICLLGLAGGVITAWIGIHALFGFFIAGIMAGEARALSENTRQVMRQMVRAIMVPVFFATIGLKLDFVGQFHLGLVALFLAIGIGGRFLGAWVGAALSRQPRETWTIISAAHTPGGEMQIVVGMLAIEYGVITQPVYVAIIFGAIASSVLLGPWMRWALGRMRRLPVLEHIVPEAVLLDLRAHSRSEALHELCAAAVRRAPALDLATAHAAVSAREHDMGTALGNGIAVPHARLPGLERTVLVMARTAQGIDWNAPDGLPARLVFLILTPADDAGMQLRILGALAKALRQAPLREALLAAGSPRQFHDALRDGLQAAAGG